MSNSRRCGNGVAHRACRYAGERAEAPIRLDCWAEDEDYERCAHKDANGLWHRFWYNDYIEKTTRKI